jgi:hypothetical protein
MLGTCFLIVIIASYMAANNTIQAQSGINTEVKAMTEIATLTVAIGASLLDTRSNVTASSANWTAILDAKHKEFSRSWFLSYNASRETTKDTWR